MKIVLSALFSLWLFVNMTYASTFQECDNNKDNKLSMDEVVSCGLGDIGSKFKTLDINKDGFLDKAELKANR